MANWTTTMLIFEGDKKHVAKLKQDIEKALEIQVDGADKHWLGKILVLNNDRHLLNSTDKNVTYKQHRVIPRARAFVVSKPGDIHFNSDRKAFISMIIQEAWQPCIDLFDYIEEKYCVKVYFTSQEPATNLHVKRDNEKNPYFEYDHIGVTLAKEDDSTDYTIEEIIKDFKAGLSQYEIKLLTDLILFVRKDLNSEPLLLKITERQMNYFKKKYNHKEDSEEQLENLFNKLRKINSTINKYYIEFEYFKKV